MNKSVIAIIDVGSRENERLCAELSDLGVLPLMFHWDVTLAELQNNADIKGIIVNGGPDWDSEKEVAIEIYNSDFPVLLVDHLDDAPWPEDEIERRQIIECFAGAFCKALPDEKAD